MEEQPAPRRERIAWMLGFGIGSMAWNICWPFLPLRIYAVGVGDLSDVARIVGRLSRRVAPRRILLLTLPLAVVCTAAVPLVDDLPGLMVLWTLLGLTSGGTVPAIFAWLGRISPSSSGGFALLATASMLAFALGPAVMGQVTVYGLGAPFRLAALCTLGGAVLVFVSDPKPVSAQAVG